jgi:hypothetical protein
MSGPDDSPLLPRRDFIRIGVAAGAGMVTGGAAAASAASERTGSAPGGRREHPATPRTAPMPVRNLGRTGHRVGIFSLGGQAAIEHPDNHDTAIAILERALDLGVNYIDSAAVYGGEQRWSQRHIGEVMARRRHETFLTSKTHDRTRDGSLRLLEESLRLLRTDHLDLWQLHRLSDLDGLDAVFGRGGAMEALQSAREQKMVRFLGVTGHTEPGVLMEAIRRFEFDTLLLALNAADRHHLSFSQDLLPLAVEKRMGIIGMKIPARGRLLSSWAPPPAPGPVAGQASKPGTLSMREAFDYVLSLPVSTAIIGCDSVAQLEENVELARTFTPLSAAQMAALEERVEPIQRQALFFRRWA